MRETDESRNIHKTALLVALACALQISESLIPHPLPGLRLGLANAVTLIALVTMGWRYALEITVLRVLLSSFIMGTFMSPAFILSFFAGVTSAMVTGFFYWLSRFCGRYRLSIVGISVLGALAHNLVQFYLAYFLLVKHPGIFVFLPWLCMGAVVTGWLTGMVAGQVYLKIKERQESGLNNLDSLQLNLPALVCNHYLPGDSLVHRLSAELKISVIFFLSLIVLIFNNFRLSLGLSLFLVVLVMISQVSLNFLFSRVKSYFTLVFVSFLFPVFYNSGTHTLIKMSNFKITAEGLNTGAFFAWRLFFLILLSLLLAMTTSPKDLGKGLAKVLSFFRFFGVSEKRTAAVLSLSWMAVPGFLETVRNAIRAIDFKQAKNLFNLIPLLSSFIAVLYLEAAKVTVFRES